MTTQQSNNPLWAGGKENHIRELVEKREKKIRRLLEKSRQIKDTRKKAEISDKIEKIKEQLEATIGNTTANWYLKK